MKKQLIFLGIETSCDETAASIVKENSNGRGEILSNIVSSQIDEHKEFGGVVPEIAARAHVEKIDFIIKKALKDVKYSKTDVKIKWFYDGTLNASANCIDRHLSKRKNKTAIIWVGDDPKDSRNISYQELHNNVCRAANGLKSIGIKKGDRVTIYLTMIPELAFVMLACARIGAIHSIIFDFF